MDTLKKNRKKNRIPVELQHYLENMDDFPMVPILDPLVAEHLTGLLDLSKKKPELFRQPTFLLSIKEKALRTFADICYAEIGNSEELQELRTMIFGNLLSYFGSIGTLDMDIYAGNQRAKIATIQKAAQTLNLTLEDANFPKALEEVLAEHGFDEGVVKKVIYKVLTGKKPGDDSADLGEQLDFWVRSDPWYSKNLSPGKLGEFEKAFNHDFDQARMSLSLMLDGLGKACTSALSSIPENTGRPTMNAERQLVAELFNTYMFFMRREVINSPANFVAPKDANDVDVVAGWNSLTQGQKDRIRENWLNLAQKQQRGGQTFVQTVLKAVKIKISKTMVKKVINEIVISFPLEELEKGRGNN